MIKIKNDELEFVVQALNAGIRERQVASSKTESKVSKEVDAHIIKIFYKILTRIHRYGYRRGKWCLRV